MNSNLSQVFNEVRTRMSGLKLPSLRDDNYRFTPVGEIQWNDQNLLSSSGQDKFETAAPEALGIGSDRKNIFSENVIPGASLRTWSSSTELKEILPSSSAFESDIFALASIGDSFGGFHLVVEENAKLEIPVEYFIFASGSFRNRIRIHMKKNSSLRFMNSWSSEEAKGLIYALQSFVLEEGAQLEFCDFQNLSKSSRYFIRQEFILADSAKVKVNWAAIGGGTGQTRVHVDCQGEKASFQGRRGLKMDTRQHSDFWIENWHSSPHTDSSFDQFSIVDAQARSIFNGLIRIFPDNGKSVSSHQSKSLLLSEQASSDNMPRLIIETDDVQVAHGASVSSVDPDQLYYLQCRGLEFSEARQILIRAFLSQAWSNIETLAWKSFLERKFFGDEIES